jgi:hypothetical protein
MRRLAGALGAFVAFALATPARAQEIQLTGPLMGTDRCCDEGDDPAPFRAIGLRGDLRAMAILVPAAGFTSATAAGAGGAVRYRPKRARAYEIDFGMLQGLEDATERHVPIALRALLIDSRRREWEIHFAAGATFDRVTNDHASALLFGGELGLGVDRRVDPQWNRFVLEIVLDARRSLSSADDASRWSPTVMLRVAIMNTIGYSKYE